MLSGDTISRPFTIALHLGPERTGELASAGAMRADDAPGLVGSVTTRTDHHAKLSRERLRRSPAGETVRNGTALLDARSNPHPHQVYAELFAFQSLLSKGVILTHEVGLGKTIEAGLVVTQRSAEGRRCHSLDAAGAVEG